MIEIGKKYRLTIVELSDSGYGTGQTVVTVTGREGNLIEVNGCEVINTASPLFHSLVDEEAQSEFYRKQHEKFMASLSNDDKEL